MKILCLEIHKYAPELNVLHLKNGVSIKAPRCLTIKQAKEKLFIKKGNKTGALFSSVYNDSNYSFLNRKNIGGGYYSSYLAAYRASKVYRQEGGILLDGSILPKNNVKINWIY